MIFTSLHRASHWNSSRSKGAIRNSSYIWLEACFSFYSPLLYIVLYKNINIGLFCFLTYFHSYFSNSELTCLIIPNSLLPPSHQTWLSEWDFFFSPCAARFWSCSGCVDCSRVSCCWISSVTFFNGLSWSSCWEPSFWYPSVHSILFLLPNSLFT